MNKKELQSLKDELKDTQIEFLRTLNKELSKQSQWQLIETAPKDGTWVLAIEKHSTHPFIANFRKEKAGNIIFEHWYADNNYVCFPIFWMPLPNTPIQN